MSGDLVERLKVESKTKFCLRFDGVHSSRMEALCKEAAAELTRLRSEKAELAHPELLGWRSETIKRDGRPGVAITFDRPEDMHKFLNWLMRNVEISRPSGGGK